MNGPQPDGAGVALVNLRGAEPARADQILDRALQVAQAEHGALIRALVLVDAARLDEHAPVFEKVLGRRRVDRMICLVIGAPVDRASGLALRATKALDNESVAILWVGDVAGVGLRMDASAVRPARVVHGDDEPVLSRLIEAIRTGDVFDRIVLEAQRLPARTASPGFWVTTGRVDVDALLAAHRAAITMVVGRPADDASADRTSLPLGGCAALLGRLDALPANYPGPLRADSPLRQLSRRCAQVCAEAAREVRAMASLSGLFGPDRPGKRVWAQVTSAGRAAATYRDALAALFAEGDIRAGLDQSSRDELERQGVDWRPVPGLDRAAVMAKLNTEVDLAIGRLPLRTLVSWLRLVSDQAAPHGSAGYADRLDPVASGVAGRLRNPPPFVLPARPPAVLAAVVAGCLLAALSGPLGSATGVAFVLGWTALAWLALSRQPVATGERGLPATARPALLWHLGAGLVGVALGRVAAEYATVPVVAVVLLAAVAAAGLLATLSWWWSIGVRAWERALGLDEALSVSAGLDSVLHEVAVMQWVLADLRVFLSHAARTVATALRDIANTMESGQHDGTGAPPSPTAASWDVQGDLRAVIVADLADAVREVMAPCWSRFAAGAFDLTGVGLAEEAEKLLGDYRQHLLRHNIHKRPAFARHEVVASGVSQFWGPPGRLTGVVCAPTGGLLVQMCHADDLGLLDLTLEGTRVVRFSPRSAQAIVLGARGDAAGRTPAVGLDEVLWTATGHLAGVVRLVPLKPGAVELTWSMQGGDEYHI